ncbi:polyprenyl synthetase family protein [Treponema sp. OMZ 840]|uniref:polyprenyl synthetase family protein n=1 Tax=Treponema sp. OMZ 840 TaxID=244313 RepID=UPI003D8F514A
MNSDFKSRLKKIEAVLQKNLPGSPYTALWKHNAFGKIDKAVCSQHIEALTEPCRILIESGGKRWRPLFMILCAEAASERKKNKTELIKQAYSLCPLVEFVHTASLIHDDIEDNADMRRGKPAAHISWGIDTALNAASWLYFQASACLTGIAPALKIKLYDALTAELRRLHLGQAMDISWHKNNAALPTVREYLAMTSLKTGTLASLSARCGILAGGGSPEKAGQAALYAADIGVAFQIQDDIINLTRGNVGKKRGDDIVEGKKSLPVLYHLQEHPEDLKKLMSYFECAAREGIDSPAVEKAVNLLLGGNAVQRALKQSTDLIEASCTRIQKLYPGTTAVRLITELFSGLQKC